MGGQLGQLGQLDQLFMLAGREEFARANLLFSASKPLLYSLDIINTIVSMPKHHTYDS
ncbi:MAG: hypothetical protein SPE53_05865 [Prevotella sp.]|nr:hypothetical protein [Prevotella sp.]